MDLGPAGKDLHASASPNLSCKTQAEDGAALSELGGSFWSLKRVCAAREAHESPGAGCGGRADKGGGGGELLTLLVLASLLTLNSTSSFTLPAWEKTSVRAASSVVRGILAKKICRPLCKLDPSFHPMPHFLRAALA